MLKDIKHPTKYPEYMCKEKRRYMFDTLAAWKHAFKTLDLMFEYQFISPVEIKNLFQDEKMVKQVVHYIVGYHMNQFGLRYHYIMDNLTESWDWKDSLKFLSVLGYKEECIMNFVFLIGKVKAPVPNCSRRYQDRELENFDRSFSCEKYFSKFLDKSNDSKLSRSSLFSGTQYMIHPNYNDKEDIQEIIDKLVTQNPHLDGLIHPSRHFL
ncbi:hypothetical protein PGTUg99_010417 [Puccinia graminis f. sp. tritici]|uniref:Uncharacterized protein n=1 Tax=Puccinia graminis f. sp. tritici TaxID=56615 RepID=A0A5B0S372_PUCGR|nr:hypothetical protein PGTUg99_010417 [Puccinia graminis f. sp. tritici]